MSFESVVGGERVSRWKRWGRGGEWEEREHRWRSRIFILMTLYERSAACGVIKGWGNISEACTCRKGQERGHERCNKKKIKKEVVSKLWKLFFVTNKFLANVNKDHFVNGLIELVAPSANFFYFLFFSNAVEASLHEGWQSSGIDQLITGEWAVLKGARYEAGRGRGG